MSLHQIIDSIEPGSKARVTLAHGGREKTFVVYYDEQGARGDDGLPVHGDVTGDFEAWELVGPDEVRDLKLVKRQHVSPHGSSGYGNDRAKPYAVEQIVTALSAKVFRP